MNILGLVGCLVGRSVRVQFYQRKEGCELDAWCAVVRSAWFACLSHRNIERTSAPEHNFGDIESGHVLIIQASERLSRIKSLNPSPFLLSAPGVLPMHQFGCHCFPSSNDSTAVIDTWLRFFKTVFDVTMATPKFADQFRYQVSSSGDPEKRRFLIDSLAFMLQLILKVGRFSLIFGYLCWLYKLCSSEADGEAAENKAANISAIDISRPFYTQTIALNCLRILNEAVFLSDQEADRKGLNHLPSFSAFKELEPNYSASLSDLGLLVDRCLSLLAYLASLQHKVWKKHPQPAVPSAKVLQSTEPNMMWFRLVSQRTGAAVNYGGRFPTPFCSSHAVRVVQDHICLFYNAKETTFCLVPSVPTPEFLPEPPVLTACARCKCSEQSTNHQIAHVASNPRSRYLIAVTSCGDFFAWYIDEKITGTAASVTNEAKQMPGNDRAFPSTDSNRCGNNLTTATRATCDTGCWGNLWSTTLNTVHMWPRISGLSKPVSPIFCLNSRQWLSEALPGQVSSSSPAFLTAVCLAADNRILLGCSNGYLLVTKVTPMAPNLEVAYIVPPPSYLPVPSSDMCLRHLDTCGDYLAAVWEQYQSDTQSIIKTVVAIYRDQSLIESVSSARRIKQLVAVAGLFATLDEQGEVFAHCLRGQLKCPNRDGTSAETPELSVVWRRVADKVSAMASTYPGVVAAPNAPVNPFNFYEHNALLPGVLLITRPRDEVDCAGGCVVHVSAADYTVSLLPWTDSSLPGGLQGLEFVNPTTCIVWYFQPTLFDTLNVNNDDGGSEGSSTLPSLIHPFVLEVSCQAIRLMLSTLKESFSEIIAVTNSEVELTTIAKNNLRSRYRMASATLKLLKLHFHVGCLRSLSLPEELRSKVLCDLSTLLEEAERNIGAFDSDQSSLLAATRSCLVAGWSLLTSHKDSVLLSKLQDQLELANHRNHLITSLLIASLLNVYGASSSQEPLLSITKEGAARIHRLLCSITSRKPVKEKVSLKEIFPLLALMIDELFLTAVEEENGQSGRQHARRYSTRPITSENPVLKCRHYLTNDACSTEEAGASYVEEFPKEVSLDMMVAFVLAVQRELVRLLSSLASSEASQPGQAMPSRALPHLSLLRALCVHVSQAALQTLGQTIPAENDNFRHLIRTERSIVACRGLTSLLPQLALDVTWLLRQCTRVIRKTGRSCNKANCCSVSNWLAFRIVGAQLPDIMCNGEPGGVLKHLRDFNKRCSTFAFHSSATSVSSGFAFRDWKRKTRSFFPDELKMSLLTGLPSSGISTRRPAIIGPYVYDLSQLKDPLTLWELSSCREAKELDITSIFDQLSFSTKTRRELAGCFMGFVKERRLLECDGLLYKVEALLVISQMQSLSALLRDPLHISSRNPLACFGSLSSYRHRSIDVTRLGFATVRKTQVHLMEEHFLDSLLGDRINVDDNFNKLGKWRDLLRKWLLPRLPLPKLVVNEATSENIEPEIKCLENCVLAAVGTLIYHTGLLRFLVLELDSMAETSCFDCLRCLLPGLSTFVRSLIHSHQIKGINYACLLESLLHRACFLCLRLEALYSPVPVKEVESMPPVYTFKHSLSNPTPLAFSDDKTVDEEKDLDETESERLDRISILQFSHQSYLNSTVVNTADSGEGVSPVYMFPSRWHWAFQKIVRSCKQCRPTLWDVVIKALRESETRTFIHWASGSSHIAEMHGNQSVNNGLARLRKIVTDLIHFLLNSDCPAVTNAIEDVTGESALVASYFPRWEAARRLIDPVLPGASLPDTDAPFGCERFAIAQQGLRSLAIAYLLDTKVTTKDHPLDVFSELFGSKLSEKMSRLPSGLALHLESERSQFMSRLICSLRVQLSRAQNTLFAANRPQTTSTNKTVVTLCLDDLPWSKEISLTLQLLCKMFLEDELGSLPVTLRKSCALSSDVLLSSFVSLLHNVERLSGVSSYVSDVANLAHQARSICCLLLAKFARRSLSTEPSFSPHVLPSAFLRITIGWLVRNFNAEKFPITLAELELLSHILTLFKAIGGHPLTGHFQCLYKHATYLVFDLYSATLLRLFKCASSTPATYRMLQYQISILCAHILRVGLVRLQPEKRFGLALWDTLEAGVARRCRFDETLTSASDLHEANYKSLLSGSLEELIHLMRHLLCFPSELVDQMRSTNAVGSILATVSWWVSGGLKDGLEYRLTFSPLRWLHLATLASFLVGIDARPYLGCLVNYSDPSQPGHFGYGVVTGLVEEATHDFQFKNNTRILLQVLPITKPSKTNSGEPGPRNPFKPPDDSISFKAFGHSPNSSPLSPQFVSCTSSSESLIDADKDEIDGLLQWTSTFGRCKHSETETEGNVFGIFGRLRGIIQCSLPNVVRVIFFPNPLKNIIELESQSSLQSMPLAELSRILVTVSTSPDVQSFGTRLSLRGAGDANFTVSATETSKATCQFVWSMLLRLLEQFTVDATRLLCDQASFTPPVSSRSTNADEFKGEHEHIGELPRFLGFLAHGVANLYEADSKGDSMLAFLNALLANALRSRAALPCDILPFGCELSHAPLKNMCQILEDCLIIPTHAVACASNPIVPTTPRRSFLSQPGINLPSTSLNLDRLPSTVKQLVQMGFGINNIVDAVEQLGGPSIGHLLHNTKSNEVEPENWPPLPSIEAIIDVLLVLSPDSDAPGAASPTTVSSPRFSWMEEINPTPATAAHRLYTDQSIRVPPVHLYSFFGLENATVDVDGVAHEDVRSSRHSALEENFSDGNNRHLSDRLRDSSTPFDLSAPNSDIEGNENAGSSAGFLSFSSSSLNSLHQSDQLAQRRNAQIFSPSMVSAALRERAASRCVISSSTLRLNAPATIPQSHPDSSPSNVSCVSFNALDLERSLSVAHTRDQQQFLPQSVSSADGDRFLPHSGSTLKPVKIGDFVVISVDKPFLGWGRVKEGSAGRVIEKCFVNDAFVQSECPALATCISPSGPQCIIRVAFPEEARWIGMVHEVRHAAIASSSDSEKHQDTPVLMSAQMLEGTRNFQQDVEEVDGSKIWNFRDDLFAGSEYQGADDQLWLRKTLANARASELTLHGWWAEREFFLGLTRLTEAGWNHTGGRFPEGSSLEANMEDVSNSRNALPAAARRCLRRRVLRWFGESTQESSFLPPPVLSSRDITDSTSHDDIDYPLRTDFGSVYVWGLNDKDQLGGPRGSKVKLPQFNTSISGLAPVHVVGGSKCLFFVTENGEVYACGDASDGKLGLSPTYALPSDVVDPEEVPCSKVTRPRRLDGLRGVRVVKVAVHSGSRHGFALSAEGQIYAWGDGSSGQLGLGSRSSAPVTRPQLVTATLSEHCIVDVAVGSGYSAAITATGKLFTWGTGKSGRLGHGDLNDRLVPTQVRGLEDHLVIQVACGSREAQTLVLTSDSLVWAWGDGEFGKLGLGSTDNHLSPTLITAFLDLPPVIFLGCGAQFSVALTLTGRVFTWGKGDYFRLGHGDVAHVSVPTLVKPIASQNIIQVAVGALHCLAVTDTGRVLSWGDNDHGQLGNGLTSVNSVPSIVLGLPRLAVDDLIGCTFRVTCGSSHSAAYLQPTGPDVERLLHPLARSMHLAALYEAGNLSPYSSTPVHIARRLHSLRSIASQRLSGSAVVLFPDSPKGLLGRQYTNTAFNAAVSADLPSVKEDEIGSFLDASAYGLSTSGCYRPLPFQVPVKDPLGFSFLGLVDAYVEASAWEPLASPLEHSSRTFQEPIDEALGCFNGVDSCPEGIFDVLDSLPVPVGFGRSLCCTEYEQRLLRLAGGMPREGTVNRSSCACEATFSKLVALLLQCIQSSILRDLASLVFFWMCSQSTQAKTAEKQLRLKSQMDCSQLRNSPSLKFTAWLKEPLLLHWLDLIHLYLKPLLPSVNKDLQLEFIWPPRPGAPVSTSDFFLRHHVSWLAFVLEEGELFLRRLVASVCLLEVEAVSTMADSCCQSPKPSVSYLSDSFLRRASETRKNIFPQVLERGIHFLQSVWRPEDNCDVTLDNVSLSQDALVLTAPSLLFVQVFLVSGLLDEDFVKDLNFSVQLCVSLARLALCPGTNDDRLRYSASCLPCWRARDWAVGAMIRLLEPPVPHRHSLLRVGLSTLLTAIGGGGSVVAWRRGSSPASPVALLSREQFSSTLDGCDGNEENCLLLGGLFTCAHWLRSEDDVEVNGDPKRCPKILGSDILRSGDQSRVVACNWLLAGQEHNQFSELYSEVAFRLTWFLEFLPCAIQLQFAFERSELVDGNQLNHSCYLMRCVQLAMKLGFHRLPVFRRLSTDPPTRIGGVIPKERLLIAHPFFNKVQFSSSSASSVVDSVRGDLSQDSNGHPVGSWNWFHRLTQCLELLDLILRGDKSLTLPPEICAAFEATYSPNFFRNSDEEEDENSIRGYSNHLLFGANEDAEIVQWVCDHPDHWEGCWPYGYDQVWAWGQNDSGQLGGVEGRTVRVPCLAERLCELNPVSISAGLLTLYIVTDRGRLFVCGYAHNDRLGVSVEANAYQPILVSSLSGVHIVKVAVHPSGQHCVALDADGNVYSWGTQTHGRLGHGGVITPKGPKAVEALRPTPRHGDNGKPFRVVDVFAGYAHSAAITATGDLYTWGHGLTGSLGHGDLRNQRRPKLVEALIGRTVVEVACAGEMTPMLILLSDTDTVWHCGNTRYEKWDQDAGTALLPTTPEPIEALRGCAIVHVANGGCFSVALSKSGVVYTWGASFLGGHSNQCVSPPNLIPSPSSALRSERIVSVSCGSNHCLALTDTGGVFAWGANDQGQLGDGKSLSRQTPLKISSTGRQGAFQIAAGSSHSFMFIRDPYSPSSVVGCTDKAKANISAGPLPVKPPPPEYHSLNSVADHAHVAKASYQHLRLLRDRFLFLHWVADQVCGGRLASKLNASLSAGCSLMIARLQSSACFGFLPAVCQIVEDGISTGRLASLLNPAQTHRLLAKSDTRLDRLSVLLLLQPKELLLRRLLQATTHPALLHGPELRITRLSLSMSWRVPDILTDGTSKRADEVADPQLTVFAQVARHMLQMNEYSTSTVGDTSELSSFSQFAQRLRLCSRQLTAGRPTMVPRPPRLQIPPQAHFWLSRRAWKVSLVGESVDDCGGGFSDCLAEICDELHAPWSGLPILVPLSSFNASSASGSERGESLSSSVFIVNPDCAVLAPTWLVFLGCLMGFGVRTGHSLHLRLSQPIWRLLCARRGGLKLAKMISLDTDISPAGCDLLSIAKMSAVELQQADLCFSCLSSNRQHTVDLLQFVRQLATASEPLTDVETLHLLLSHSGIELTGPSDLGYLWESVIRVAARNALALQASEFDLNRDNCPGAHVSVTPDNRIAYLLSVLIYRRLEFEPAVRLIRRGLAQVLPVTVLALFTPQELESLVCGNPEISIDALQQLVTYDNLLPDDELAQWFWTIVKEMNHCERSLLLRFVWGRSRLPRFASDLRERQFHIRVQAEYRPPDAYLPEGSTCLFTLRLPRYSCLEIFRERLRYAIFSCRSIDSDDLVMLE